MANGLPACSIYVAYYIFPELFPLWKNSKVAIVGTFGEHLPYICVLLTGCLISFGPLTSEKWVTLSSESAWKLGLSEARAHVESVPRLYAYPTWLTMCSAFHICFSLFIFISHWIFLMMSGGMLFWGGLCERGSTIITLTLVKRWEKSINCWAFGGKISSATVT